jgi:hypothetical protein
MPNQILLDIINEHLPYDIDMLRRIYTLFGQTNPSLPQDDRKRQYDAMINSFCVHARSLFDFFSNKRTDRTDSIAADFTIGYTPTFDLSIEPLYSLRRKLNKQVFHLTTDRTVLGAAKFQPDTDAQLVFLNIEPAIAHFIATLAPDFHHFRCNSAPVTFISTTSQPSATGAISQTSLTINPP